MIQLILSIRDTKAELFLSPMFVPTAAVAYRDIAAHMARGGDENQLALFPQDFELYQLGTFDTETGAIEALEGFPKRLCSLEALAAPK